MYMESRINRLVPLKVSEAMSDFDFDRNGSLGEDEFVDMCDQHGI